MNCSEVQELLSAYHDGELADDQRSHVSDHLDECADCAVELAGFQNLSTMASALGTPEPPEHIWSQLKERLDQHPSHKQPAAKPVGQLGRWSFPAARRFAFAATVLVAVGIGWFAYRSWFPHDEHHQFRAEFGHYLEKFGHDPDAAQQILLAKYENQLVDPEQVIERVGYRPAVADGLPEGYTLASTHVMKMPCCTCVQSVCKRSDGSTLAIFEHDDSSCRDKHCCIVEVDDQIAASWKHGTRHITLIGVHDDDEVSQMVAWLDQQRRPVPN